MPNVNAHGQRLRCCRNIHARKGYPRPCLACNVPSRINLLRVRQGTSSLTESIPLRTKFFAVTRSTEDVALRLSDVDGTEAFVTFFTSKTRLMPCEPCCECLLGMVHRFSTSFTLWRPAEPIFFFLRFYFTLVHTSH